MDNPQALPIGTRLAGEYRIESVLGSGGFGITYLAQEETLQRKVAIKEYFPTGLATRAGSMLVRSKGDKGKGRYVWGLDRFIHEAQILAKFNHGNINRVYRYFRENNTAYMVLHYENGLSLKAWLDGLGRAPLQTELDAMLEKILPALQLIHDADYLHRDIAPDNILVRSNGSPVLIDFGSARGEVAQQSKTVSAIVKPGYSPFEQYAMDGKQQGPWTDIYSLGATLYYAISRRRPLDAPGRMSSDKHKSAFDAARGQYRKGFLRAIDMALEVKPENRPAHIGEWCDMLYVSDRAPAVATMKTVLLNDGAPAQKRGRNSAPVQTQTPGSTRRAGTMPAVPSFLRKKKVKQVAPLGDTEPNQPQSEMGAVQESAEVSNPEKYDSLGSHNGIAQDPAKSGSLGKRLAKVSPSGDIAAQNCFNQKDETKDARYYDRIGNIPGAAGAAALPDHVDIPLTRMVHAATSFGAGLFAYLIGILRLALTIPVRIIRAAITPQTRPQPKQDTKLPKKQKPAQLANPKPIPKFTRMLRLIALLLIAVLLTSFAIHKKWIPNGWVTEAQATLVNFKRDWPRLKDDIEQSYSTTLASVAKLRRVFGIDAKKTNGTVQILRGHIGMVQTAIFTPDGNHIISGGIDERLRLWSVASGRLERILSKEQGSITALDIRGNALLAAEANGIVVLKNWQTGKTLNKVRHHNGLVRSIAIANSKLDFFTAGQDGVVKYWRNGSPEPDLTHAGENGAIHAISLQPSKNRIATAGADRNIRIWDFSLNKLVRKFRGHRRAISSVDFSPDGKYLVSASLDGKLKLWSSRSYRTRRTLRGHKGRIFMARFSPDGRLVASAGEDGTVRLWNVRRRGLIHTFRGHEGAVRSVAFSTDGRKLVSGSDDGTVRIWTIHSPGRKMARRFRR